MIHVRFLRISCVRSAIMFLHFNLRLSIINTISKNSGPCRIVFSSILVSIRFWNNWFMSSNYRYLVSCSLFSIANVHRILREWGFLTNLDNASQRVTHVSSLLSHVLISALSVKSRSVKFSVPHLITCCWSHLSRLKLFLHPVTTQKRKYETRHLNSHCLVGINTRYHRWSRSLEAHMWNQWYLLGRYLHWSHEQMRL